MATLDIIGIVLAVAVLVFYNKNCNVVLSKSWIGHAFFAVLLVFAVIYAKERVLLIDSSSQLFEIINGGGFVIYDHRFSMCLSQLLPLLMVKINAPLWVIMYSYSISFVLLYYLAYLFVQYVVKDNNGIVLMMFGFLCVTHTFFHTISETMQLMFMAAALYSLLCHSFDGSGLKQILCYLAYVALIAFCVFIHPISLFILTFIFLFRIIDSKKIDVKTIIGIVAFVILYQINYKMMKSNTRESSIVLTYDMMMDMLPHIFESSFYEAFWLYFWDYCYIPTILAIVVTLFYIFKKNYIKALFMIAYLGGFLAITLITYFRPDYNIGVERAFMPLMFFVGVPLIYDVIPRAGDRYNVSLIAFIAILAISRYYGIEKAGVFYSQRLNSLEKITDFADDVDCQKLIIRRATANALFFPLWGESIGTMMMSSMKNGPEHTVSLYVADDDFEKDLDLITDNNFLYVDWSKILWYDRLNTRYFKLKRQPYMEVVVEDGDIALIDVGKTTCDEDLAHQKLELMNKVDAAFKQHGIKFMVVTAPEKEKLFSKVDAESFCLAQPLAEYGIPYINMTDIRKDTSEMLKPGEWDALCERGVDSVFRSIRNTCQSDKIKVLFVGGDFIWKMRDDITWDGQFEDYELWYFNGKVFFGKSKDHSISVIRKNRVKELLMSDWVVFFCDGKQLCDDNYKFLEEVLNDLNAVDDTYLKDFEKESVYCDYDAEFEKMLESQIQAFKNDTNYMKDVPKNAKDYGVTSEEVIKMNAMWMIENQPADYH